MAAGAQPVLLAFALYGATGYLATHLASWTLFNTNLIKTSSTPLPALSKPVITGMLQKSIAAFEAHFKSRKGIRQLYRFGDAVVPGLLYDLINNALEDLEEDKNAHLTGLIYRLYHRALPKLRLTYDESDFAVNLVFSALVTPPYIRNTLAQSLTPNRIEHMEQSILSQMHFWQGLFARLIDIKKLLSQLQSYLVDHPAEADQVILELMDQLEIREHLAEAIAHYNPDNLDPDTRASLADYLAVTTQHLLVDHRTNIAALIANLSRGTRRSISKAFIKADYKKWLVARYPNYEEALTNWLYGVLSRQLPTGLLPTTALQPIVEGALGKLAWLIALFSGLAGVLLHVLIR